MAKINSSDLCNALAAEMGLSTTAAKSYMDFLFDEILRHVADGDEVSIKKFGKFYLSVTPPHKGRDLSTGVPVDVKSRSIMKFAVSERLVKDWNSVRQDT